MGTVAKKEQKGDFEPIKAGNHVSRCYGYADLGTHYDERWKNRKREVVIWWEVPSERIEYEVDGEMVDRPRSVSKKYTLSLGDRAILKKDLESWRGRPFTVEELKGFDLDKIVGHVGLVNITHNDSKDKSKVYANVSTITPLPDGLECGPAENEQVKYTIVDRDGNFVGQEIPERIKGYFREQIESSDEYKRYTEPEGQCVVPTTVAEPDDELPF